MEASVRKGEKVAEKDLVTVTELLMNELLKLDAVVAGGDVKAQRRVQVRAEHSRATPCSSFDSFLGTLFAKSI